MKEYEIVARFYNACAGDSRPETFFEERELACPEDFIRMKHGKDFDKFVKEVQANGRSPFRMITGALNTLTNSPNCK